MILKEIWSDMFRPDGRAKDRPAPFSIGKYQSWNTAGRDLEYLGMFLLMAKPKIILECGTHEGHFVEYAINLMNKNGILFDKIYTYDQWNMSNIDEWQETEPDFIHSVIGRNKRLKELNERNDNKIVYIEGKTEDVLRPILLKDKVNFIYYDAGHTMTDLLNFWKEITNISSFLAPDLIICFDDIRDDAPTFKNLIDLKGWIALQNNNTDRGQLWVERIDK